ncbi:MAG TPA: hypothetical protein VJK54_08255, partial [Chthoniobacterales bacterium]|nr:hypothetical protein [Chthoniobacterales bacterium]
AANHQKEAEEYKQKAEELQKQGLKTEVDSIANEQADAKVKADDQAAKELKEAINIAQAAKELKEAKEVARATWNTATEISLRADTAENLAARTKVESDYREAYRLAQEASNAWFKTEEAKKIALSQIALSQAPDKAVLIAKINASINRKPHYDQLATLALENAKTAAIKLRIDAEVLKLPVEVREKAARVMIQIEEAKQASKEESDEEYLSLWDSIAIKLEQSRDSYYKFSELVSLGNFQKASLWKKVAEESAASTEGIRRAINVYKAEKEAATFTEGITAIYDPFSFLLRNESVAEQIEKETRSAYYLSDVSTWSLKSAEALEKSNQIQGKDRELWINLAEQYTLAVDYARYAASALSSRESVFSSVPWNFTSVPWNLAGRSAYTCANYKEKEAKARETSKITLAAGYREAIEISLKAVERYKQAAEIARQRQEKDRDAIFEWQNTAKSLEKQADYKAKEAEAQAAGKMILVAGYREAAETSCKAAEQYKQAAEAYVAEKTKEADSRKWTGDLLQKQADYQANGIEAKDIAKMTLSVAYREASEILGKAIEQYQQSDNADGLTDLYYWRNMRESFQLQAQYQVKAAEAQEAGQTILAIDYSKAAEISQNAAEQFKKTALDSISEKNHWDNPNWHSVGQSLQKQADYQAKAAEAQKAGKMVLSAGYREATETSCKAAEQYRLGAEAKASGKNDADGYWFWKGNSLQSQADYQVKAAEAQELGKITLSAGYREATETLQHAVDQFKIATEIKKVEGNRYSLYLAGQSLQEQADYQAKAAEAQYVGKEILAASYREAYVILQRAIDQFRQSAEAYTIRNKNDGERLEKEGHATQKEAKERVKRAKTAKSLQQPEIKTEQDRIAKEQVDTKAQADAQVAKELKAAIDGTNVDMDKATEVGGKIEITPNKVNGIVQEQSLLRIEADKKLIETWKAMKKEMQEKKKKAYEQGKTAEGHTWNNACCGFGLAEDKLEKAIDAEAAGKPEIAQKWREAAEQNKCSLEPYTQSARAYEQGKTDEGKSWNDAGKAFNYAGEKLEQAIEAEERGKVAEAQTLRTKAANHQKEAEEYKQKAEELQKQGLKTEQDSIAQAQSLLRIEADRRLIETWRTMELEKKNQSEDQAKEHKERRVCKDVSTIFKDAIEKLEKAIEAESAGKVEERLKWRAAAEQQVTAVEFYDKALIAYAGGKGKRDEGDSWRDVGSILSAVAGPLVKAIEAENIGKSEIARKYREVAEQYKRSIEPYAQAARAYAAGKTAEGASWNKAGECFCRAAEYLIEAIGAEVSGKPEEALKRREIATKYQQAGEKYVQAAQARSRGTFFTGAGRLDSEGSAMMDEAFEMTKKLENK